MPRVMTLASALNFGLSALAQMQNHPEDLTGEDWLDIADDLEAVVRYARQRAEQATQEEDTNG